MNEQETQAAADEGQEKRTFVEDGSEFKGNMVSSCHVVVRGKLEGEIMAPKLTVDESGTVVGDVNAEHIQSRGVLAGTIEAEELYLSGQVRDDTVIRAKSMEVKLSQEGEKYEVTFGACTLAVGDDPRAELQNADQARTQASPSAHTSTEQVAQLQEGQSPGAEQPQQAKDAEETSAEAPQDEQGGNAEAAAEAKDTSESKEGGRKRKGKGRRAEMEAQAEGDKDAAAVVPTPSNPPPAQ